MIKDIKLKSLGKDMTYREGRVYCKLWDTEIDVDLYDCGWPDPLKGEQIPYWYAFWETPHTSGYGPDEFRKVNSVLFPKGTDELEIYEWTTDWSNYFEAGREWWGTACWSVYDKRMNRYIVIMAETTD